jgi:hypothetical protein
MSQVDLFEYGIEQELADLRAHVCWGVGIVYVFETAEGIAAKNSREWKTAYGYQPGVSYATGEGKLVPVEAINGMREARIPEIFIRKYPIGRNDDTSIKGQKAEAIIKAMIRKGRFPFPKNYEAIDPNRVEFQKKGIDIIVIKPQEITVQVKCDYLGGDKILGGTGNLFIQEKELNPLGKF